MTELKWITREPRKSELIKIEGSAETRYENVFITIDLGDRIVSRVYEHDRGWYVVSPFNMAKVVGWLPRDVLPPMPRVK